MLLDVPLPFWTTSQALGRVLGHQLGERKRRNSHSQSVRLLPRMSALRSPQGAAMPRWAACTRRPLPRDAPHQGPDAKRGSHLLCLLLVLQAEGGAGAAPGTGKVDNGLQQQTKQIAGTRALGGISTSPFPLGMKLVHPEVMSGCW